MTTTEARTILTRNFDEVYDELNNAIDKLEELKALKNTVLYSNPSFEKSWYRANEEVQYWHERIIELKGKFHKLDRIERKLEIELNNLMHDEI